MEHTGIVRRIDEIGRVVIPKEIRRTLQIREGDPLDISVKNATISIKKYHPEKVFHFNDEELEEIVEALKEREKDKKLIITCNGLTELSQLDEDELFKHRQSRYLCKSIINKIEEITEEV